MLVSGGPKALGESLGAVKVHREGESRLPTLEATQSETGSVWRLSMLTLAAPESTRQSMELPPCVAFPGLRWLLPPSTGRASQGGRSCHPPFSPREVMEE